MKTSRVTLALACLLLSSAGMVRAETGMTKMTLYTYDDDKGGESSCYDDCATNWPPYLAKTGETLGEGWTMAARKDGAMQWAYDGKPAYFYIGDKKAGDVTGDGKGGVWHVIKAE
ncbi:hypothetical protein [Paracoccus sp. IB05]|uniref:COG4315 family predicted lipoprotein n=1 Tax=Paracoccus sp. IB05 TaxID=2779367 RepID=UPI0018E84318|nr:hypothetical protein [Paracoccus sp. IB05]MBJ2152038.1 hypothetical protein [Paracoccus sp. IB05]